MRILLPEPGPLPDGGLEELYDETSPYLRAGFVLSIDGAAAVEGRTRGLHTESDAAVFRALRHVADAVVVGAGTARAEAYGPVVLTPAGQEWRAAAGRDPEVPLVVVSQSLRLDSTARMLQGGRTIVVTCAAAPVERRAVLREAADVLVCGDESVDLDAAVSALRERGLARLLCEGGPTLLRDLLDRDLVDELCLTVSPRLVGGALGLLPLPALDPPRELQLTLVVDGGDDALLCRWRVLAPDRADRRAPG